MRFGIPFQRMHRIADSRVPRLRAAVQAALNAAYDSVTLEDADRTWWQSTDAIDHAVDWPKVAAILGAPIGSFYVYKAESAATVISEVFLDAGGTQAGLMGVRLDLTNQHAIDYAQRRSGALITDLQAKQRQTVRKLTSRALQEGIPPEQLGRMLRRTVGLTERQAYSMFQYQKGLLETYHDGHTSIPLRGRGRPLADKRFSLDPERLSDKRINEMADRYRERMVAYRANTIARTETMRAANYGALAEMREAGHAGMFDMAQAELIWMTAPDDATCDECEGLDGTVIGFTEQFQGDGEDLAGGMDAPPAHPNCRCTVELNITDEALFTAFEEGGDEYGSVGETSVPEAAGTLPYTRPSTVRMPRSLSPSPDVQELAQRAEAQAAARRRAEAEAKRVADREARRAAERLAQQEAQATFAPSARPDIDVLIVDDREMAEAIGRDLEMLRDSVMENGGFLTEREEMGFRFTEFALDPNTADISDYTQFFAVENEGNLIAGGASVLEVQMELDLLFGSDILEALGEEAAERLKYLYVEYVGTTGVAPGTGTELVKDIYRHALDADLPLMGHPTADALPFWEKMGWVEDPLGVGSEDWGITQEGMARFLGRTVTDVDVGTAGEGFASTYGEYARNPMDVIRFADPAAEQFEPLARLLSDLHGWERNTTFTQAEMDAVRNIRNRNGMRMSNERADQGVMIATRPEDGAVVEGLEGYFSGRQSSPRMSYLYVDASEGGIKRFHTFTHEWGHRVDFVGGGQSELMRKKGLGFYTGADSVVEEGIQRAIDDFLLAAVDNPYFPEMTERYVKVLGKSYREYFEDPAEIWARAYSQWAGIKLEASFPDLEFFRTRVASGHQLAEFWPDEYFRAEMAPRLEQVLRSRGLLR